MKVPFTLDEFMDVFRNYNLAVFPMQVVLYVLALVAIYFAFKPNSRSSAFISGLLVFLWWWMGIVYHLIFFTTINNAAYLFGGAFIVQGFFFLWTGIYRNKLSFRFQPGIYGATGIILLVFALIIYPILGYYFGHVYPNAPGFGLPCPTTIFTFGLLLFCDKRCPVYILIIPFTWSIIGFTAAFNFGILEDTGLVVAGLITLPMILIKNRRFQKS